MLPARIVEFFPETQTATILICAETLFNSSDSIADSKLREPLEGVPVHTVGGGGWHITMPIKAGDTCIISFSQVGYDHWLYEDKNEAGLLAGLPKPHLRRQFNEDDGFATVGFNTLPRAIKKFSATDSTWINDNVDHEAGEDFQVITLKEDLSIVIDSSVSLTINAPSVVVNCETSEVNATTSSTITTPTATVECGTSDINASESATVTTPTATVSCEDAIVDATASMKVTTADFTVDCPMSTFTGLVSCSGMGAGAAPAAGVVKSSGDVVAGSVSVQGHNHDYVDSVNGAPTTKTTNAPN